MTTDAAAETLTVGNDRQPVPGPAILCEGRVHITLSSNSAAGCSRTRRGSSDEHDRIARVVEARVGP